MSKSTTILSLFTILLLASCGKDNKINAPDNLLELELGSNYFNQGTQVGYAILSRLDGTLIDYKSISNNTTVIFENTEETTSPFTVTFLTGSSTLTSILEVPVGSKWLLDNPVFNNEMPTGKSNIVIENIGDISPSPFFASGSNVRGIGYDYPSDSMVLSLSLDIASTFLAIFRSTLDDKVRYFFDDTVEPGSTLNLGYQSLPIIADATTVDMTSSTIGYFSIKGDPIGEEDGLLTISEKFNVSGTTEHYVPENIFEKLFTYADGQLPSNDYFTAETFSQNLPQSVVIPDFDFDINATANGISFSSSPGFDVFTACLRNSAQNTLWCIVSERKSVLTFNLPSIPSSITNGNLDLTGLQTYSFGALNYEPFESFGDHMTQRYSKDGVDFEKFESIARFY